jgi:hypothetical protein
MDAEGKFVERKNMVVSLSRGTSTISNPETSNAIIALFIITIIVSVASIIGIKKHNQVTTMILVIGLTVLVLPITILAIDELQIKFNSKVTIRSSLEFCVYDKGLTLNEIDRGADESYSYFVGRAYKYNAILGMTFDDFKNSKYYNQVGNEIPKNSSIFDDYDSGVSNFEYYYTNPGTIIELLKRDGTGIGVQERDKIVSCNEGVYLVHTIS